MGQQFVTVEFRPKLTEKEHYDIGPILILKWRFSPLARSVSAIRDQASRIPLVRNSKLGEDNEDGKANALDLPNGTDADEI